MKTYNKQKEIHMPLSEVMISPWCEYTVRGYKEGCKGRETGVSNQFLLAEY